MTELPGSSDGWREWSRYVLKELEHSREASESLRKEIAALRTDYATQGLAIHTELATLKTKAGMWGAIGAMIPVLLMIAIQLLLP